MDVVREACSKDSVFNMLRHYVQKGFPHNNSNVNIDLLPYLKFKDDFSCHDNLIMFRNRLLIPNALHKRIL